MIKETLRIFGIIILFMLIGGFILFLGCASILLAIGCLGWVGMKLGAGLFWFIVLMALLLYMSYSMAKDKRDGEW